MAVCPDHNANLSHGCFMHHKTGTWLKIVLVIAARFIHDVHHLGSFPHLTISVKPQRRIIHSAILFQIHIRRDKHMILLCLIRHALQSCIRHPAQCPGCIQTRHLWKVRRQLQLWKEQHITAHSLFDIFLGLLIILIHIIAHRNLRHCKLHRSIPLVPLFYHEPFA